MRRQKDPNAAPKKSSRLLACCVGVPLLLLAGAGMLFWFAGRPVHFDLPAQTLPPNNAFDDFVKAGQLAEGMQHTSPSDMPVPNHSLPTYAAASQDAQPALAALRQGLNKPYQMPRGRDFLDGGPSFRNLARVNADVAIYEERSGHSGPAMETRLDGMEMGVMLLHGSNLIGMLMSSACEAISAKNAEKLLPSLSSQELAHAAERLDKIAAKRAPLSDVFQEEGYTSTFQLQALFQGNDQQGAPQPTLQDRLMMIRFAFVSKEGILRQNLEYYKACAEEAKTPYTGPSAVQIPRNFLTQALQTDGSMITLARKKYLYQVAAAALLQTQIALYRYKAAHGKFPAALAALAPTYIKAVPDDPFGGAAGVPLHYQVKEDGKNFLLYSLGPDLKDDGGQPQALPGKDPGDIVAGKLWYSAPSNTPPAGANQSPSNPAGPEKAN